MKPYLDWLRGLRSSPTRALACATASLMTAGVCAEPTCPGFVETHSGSTFNLAALIHDKGSPAAALDDARRAVSRVNAGGGCGIFKDPAACEETLAVAKLAIDALEACTGTRSLSGSARKDPF